MIKFFRHIRRKLISENKMGKYFKYAIGEILLVVIGILIALQINNWNEQNKQNQIELTLLKRLQIDLKENIPNWNTIIEREVKVYEGSKEFISFSLREDKDSIMKVFPFLNQVARWDDITMNQVTFKEMQSSGKLDLVSNDSIKIKLLQLDHSYQKVFNRYSSIKANHNKMVLQPVDQALDFKTLIALDESYKELYPREYTYEEQLGYYELLKKEVTTLIENQTFTNFLVGRMQSYDLIMGELQDAQSQAQELQELIEEELSNR